MTGKTPLIRGLLISILDNTIVLVVVAAAIGGFASQGGGISGVITALLAVIGCGVVLGAICVLLEINDKLGRIQTALERQGAPTTEAVRSNADEKVDWDSDAPMLPKGYQQRPEWDRPKTR